MSEVIYRVKKPRHVKRNVFIVLTFLLLLAAGIVTFIFKNVNPVILTISNERVRAMSQEAISSAVLEIMGQNSSKELVSIVRDDKNNIKSVEMNNVAITELAEKITSKAQKNINAAGVEGIHIPMGSLSGITLFTGRGPDVNIRLYLVGSTKTRITSVFSESGINQTVHRLYLDIKSSVAVAVPGLPSTIETHDNVLMSETVIIGEVPPTYLKAMSVGDVLDLIAN